MAPKRVIVYVGRGTLEAETVRLFLESNGIPAFVIQESAGVTFGLTVGPLGEARVLVSADDEANALELLRAMEEGAFILPEDETEVDDDNNGNDDPDEEKPEH